MLILETIFKKNIIELIFDWILIVVLKKISIN